ncbi:MAG: hypothetical protein HQL92_07805 [Magnetococcales bacterium]|nr:hypothetical protein [Magnetococcales bacterium]
MHFAGGGEYSLQGIFSSCYGWYGPQQGVGRIPTVLPLTFCPQGIISFLSSNLGSVLQLAHFVRFLSLSLLCCNLMACASKGPSSPAEPSADRISVASEERDHKAGSDATPAQKRPVEAPKWQVGDRWLWSDGYGLEVIDHKDDWTVFARTDTERKNTSNFDSPYQNRVWYKHKGFFTVESHNGKEYRQVVFRSIDPMQLFPLEPGRNVAFSREYMNNGQLRTHRTSWTVEGWETIQTPAGKFDCLILMMRTRSTTSNWVGFERWWYSPDVRNYVRLEYKYGSLPASSRVLMSYQLVSNNKKQEK